MSIFYNNFFFQNLLRTTKKTGFATQKWGVLRTTTDATAFFQEKKQNHSDDDDDKQNKTNNKKSRERERERERERLPYQTTYTLQRLLVFSKRKPKRNDYYCKSGG